MRKVVAIAIVEKGKGVDHVKSENPNKLVPA